MIPTARCEENSTHLQDPDAPVETIHKGYPPHGAAGLCPPLLIRRWRNGKVVWEGQPDSRRLLHRGYTVKPGKHTPTAGTKAP